MGGIIEECGGLSPDTDHEDEHPINQTHFIQLQYQEDLEEKFMSGRFRWNLIKVLKADMFLVVFPSSIYDPQWAAFCSALISFSWIHIFVVWAFWWHWQFQCVNQEMWKGAVQTGSWGFSQPLNTSSSEPRACFWFRFTWFYMVSKNYFTTVTPEWNQSSLIRPEIGSSGWSAVSPGPPQLSVLSGSRFNSYGGPSGQQNSGIPVPPWAPACSPPDHVPELRILDQVVVKPTTQPRWLTHCCCLGLFGFIWMGGRTVPHVHLRDSHTHTDRQTQGWWSSNDGAGSFITIIYLTYMAGLTKNIADVLMLMWRAEAGLFNDASHMF